MFVCPFTGKPNIIKGSFVHYITVFAGRVIKAWDLGVATMKRGEVARFFCRSDYAYGETGSPPRIPPNATLVFEVELFDWKMEDISKAKDEGILRRTLKKGEGYTSPNEGALVNSNLFVYSFFFSKLSVFMTGCYRR